MATLTLGDKRFQVIDFDRRTVLQDHYVQSVIQQSGIDRLLPDESESDAGFLARVDAALLASGRTVDLIAGLLVPDGQPATEWDRKTAKETAAHIATCTDPDDRELVQQLALRRDDYVGRDAFDAELPGGRRKMVAVELDGHKMVFQLAAEARLAEDFLFQALARAAPGRGEVDQHQSIGALGQLLGRFERGFPAEAFLSGRRGCQGQSQQCPAGGPACCRHVHAPHGRTDRTSSVNAAA